MTRKEYDTIVSEITQIESLLKEIPSYNIIERKGLEFRVQQLSKKIENIIPDNLRNSAIMTFRGSPVVGSYGILADFATKVTGAFTEAIAAVSASLDDNLRYMGPIPNKDRNQLLITNIAKGSFGFEFEIPKAEEETLFVESSNTEIALEKIQELFNATMLENDDILTEIVEEIHPRAVSRIVDFLDIMYDNNSWCSLSFKEHSFRFLDLHQVQNSIRKLSQDNISEREESFTGEFQGILPSRRTFEFLASDGIIIGKIGSDIQDPDILNREYLHIPVKALFHIIQVGQGRPRYQLKDLTYLTKD